MSDRVVIEFEDGPMAGRSFEFSERDVFVLGRDADCHVSIPDDLYLSRHHFALEIVPPLVVLRELKSRNGTLVNGRRLEARQPPGAESMEVPLRDGDVVRAGRTSLRVHVVADVPEPEPDTLPESVLGSAPETESFGVPGTWAPGYELVKELGQGASGATWLARDASGTEVALKLVQLALGCNASMRARVLREIDVLRALEHPNIVRLLDAGDAGMGVYLALELCEGGSLAALLLRRRRLTWERARPVALGMLRGLAFAHERGIVHRDVKPGNVLLARTGSGWAAKVGDFGLAKVVDASGTRSGVTVTGSTAGTLEYMPREQLLEFRTLRPVSDVWSAAATIYSLLAGRAPRRRARGQDAIQVVLEGRIAPLLEVRSDVPPAVAEVLDRALAIDVDARHPSCSEMLVALEAVA